MASTACRSGVTEVEGPPGSAAGEFRPPPSTDSGVGSVSLMQAAPLGRGSERPGLAAPHPRCPLLPTGAVQPWPPPPPHGWPASPACPCPYFQSPVDCGKARRFSGRQGLLQTRGARPAGAGATPAQLPPPRPAPRVRAPHSVPCAGLGVPHTAGHVAPFFPPPPNALAWSLPTQPSAPSAGDATRSPRSSSPLVTHTHLLPFKNNYLMIQADHNILFFV